MFFFYLKNDKKKVKLHCFYFKTAMAKAFAVTLSYIYCFIESSCLLFLVKIYLNSVIIMLNYNFILLYQFKCWFDINSGISDTNL